MMLVGDLERWFEVRASLNESLGFVATMGALHPGHGSLIERSVAENTYTVVSVFVNPTQFNDPQDLANYPDTLDADLAMAERLGADYVFTPSYDALYGDEFRYQVDEREFSRELCGAHREGHFTGVLTVVMKLLNIIKPARAYFGEKDYQQYLLVRDMCEAFFLDTQIVACATVREADGLAMSSRNALLDAAGRAKAPLLYEAISSADSDPEVAARLTVAGFDVDYVRTLRQRRFAAASLHCEGRRVRLIDNVPAPSSQS